MANFRDYTFARLGRVDKTPTYPTLNDPVLLFNRFRLYEVGSALSIVVVFGVIRSEWIFTLLMVIAMLVGSPAIRKRVPPTYLYRKFLDRYSKLPIGSLTWGRSHSSL